MQQIKSGGARFGVATGIHYVGSVRFNTATLYALVRHIGLFLIVLMLVTVLGQVLYPRNRALPGQYFAGVPISMKTDSSIAGELAAINNKQLFMTTESHAYNLSLNDIGVSINAQVVANQLTSYPMSQRLVPFSFLWHNNQGLQTSFEVVDSAKLASFAQTISEESDYAPTEGTISYRDGEYIATYSNNGKEYLAQDIINALVLRGASLDTLALPYVAVPAVNSNEHVDELIARAKSIAQKDLTLTAHSTNMILPGSVVESAIQFSPNKQSSKLELNVNSKQLVTVLEPAANTFFVSPTADTAGQELDMIESAEAIASAIETERTNINIVTKTIPKGSIAYAATSDGINMLIADWQKKYAYADAAVSFNELNGMQRTAGVNADKNYFSASLYKALVAWNILKSVQDGALAADAYVVGRSIDTCLEQMIVVSESTCAEARVAQIGSWPGLDEFIHSNGVKGIAMSSGLSLTASGYANFLTKLERRELMNEENTAKLLSLMKRQNYRDGIPAGAQGEVANKVGYQPTKRSWHDGGIVYNHGSPYVLVVLGNGLGNAAIADLSTQISATLNR